jgi:hypothetical protein
MASYTTKFSLNDTVYIVDRDSLNIFPATIISISLSENLISPTKIAYYVRFINDFAGRNQYNEDELYFVEEAKAILVQLLSERSADIANLRN